MKKTEVIVDFGGIVLFDPDRLVEYFGSIDRDENLYRRLISTDAGEKVLAQGIVVPIIGINDSIYEVQIRHAHEASEIPEQLFILANDGFPLHIRGQCVLADLSAFLEWSPSDGWQVLDIPAGFYSATVRGFREISDGVVSRFGFEIVLSKTDDLPPMTASMTQHMQVLELPSAS